MIRLTREAWRCFCQGDAYAAGVLDALRSSATPVIRHHNGTHML
jgi:hypothetical protein